MDNQQLSDKMEQRIVKEYSRYEGGYLYINFNINEKRKEFLQYTELLLMRLFQILRVTVK